MTFNLRWHRSGHVYQGRYKSLLCEREAYLLELVRYIHLNPLRAGLCDGLEALGHYPWSGHRVLLGHTHLKWQDTASVLESFGPDREAARYAYIRFCEEGLREPLDRRLVGDGLKHLLEGGWEAVGGRATKRGGVATERLLGSSAFADRVLREADDHERWRSRAKRGGVTVEAVLKLAAEAIGISVESMRSRGKSRLQANARALGCYWAVERLGIPEVEVARFLGFTQSGVSRSAVKGRTIERINGLSLYLTTAAEQP